VYTEEFSTVCNAYKIPEMCIVNFTIHFKDLLTHFHITESISDIFSGSVYEIDFNVL
jgi:hypothetical protein